MSPPSLSPSPSPAADRLNIEVKARCERIDEMREILIGCGAISHGVDRQTDTYLVVPAGRMKVREGTIENALIAYDRTDTPGARPSRIALMEMKPDEAASLRDILIAALGVKIRVVKEREILFIENVKFHLDRVEGLGSFVEIEALSAGGVPPRAKLEAQAAEWRARLGLTDDAIEAASYSDLLAVR